MSKGFKGKKHSDKSKKKISEKIKRLHSEGKLVNPPNWTGKVHSQETKNKLSEIMSGNHNSRNRSDKQCYYKGIRMDSKWEVGVGRYLDRNNLTWEYGKHTFRLSSNSTYTPDFKLIDQEMFIEVKGLFREQNKRKFGKFRRLYTNIKIEIWDFNKLKSLKIINSSGYVNELSSGFN